MEGAPYTLGYASPEVTAHGHCPDPSNLLGHHKDDVHAVGVMCLVWLSPVGNMPFGPSKAQLGKMDTPEGVNQAKRNVMRTFQAWVSAAVFVCIGLKGCHKCKFMAMPNLGVSQLGLIWQLCRQLMSLLMQPVQGVALPSDLTPLPSLCTTLSFSDGSMWVYCTLLLLSVVCFRAALQIWQKAESM